MAMQSYDWAQIARNPKYLELKQKKRRFLFSLWFGSSVSPNMTYPQKIANDARKVITTLEKKQADGAVLSEKDVAALKKARHDFARNDGGVSMVGLKEPWFPLKNPAIVSLPMGLLAAIICTLLFRDKRAEEMFDEIEVRQITGLGISKAADH